MLIGMEGKKVGKREIIDEIEQLKDERKAVVIAHNYQIPDVQDIADFVGDSLQLSREAAKQDCDVIVFCGVHFMAETAAILAPDKTIPSIMLAWFSLSEKITSPL